MANELTTAQVAERFGVGKSTVNLWCRQGRFPHARTEDTLRGPVWLIPVGDLAAFVKPKRGPAPQAKPAAETKPAKRRGSKAA